MGVSHFAFSFFSPSIPVQAQQPQETLKIIEFQLPAMDKDTLHQSCCSEPQEQKWDSPPLTNAAAACAPCSASYGQPQCCAKRAQG